MITKDMKVLEIMRQHPSTAEVFLSHGVCSCCLGELTLEESVKRKGVDLEEFLKELNARL